MNQQVRFPLGKADLKLWQQLEIAFRLLLSVPDLSPEAIVALARAIRVVQRLPLCTPDVDVSITLDYETDTFKASSTVRLSSMEISADYSGGSSVGQGYEFESFPDFTFRIDDDGDYELEGDKDGFFKNFLGSAAAAAKDTESYNLTVADESRVRLVHPLEGDSCGEQRIAESGLEAGMSAQDHFREAYSKGTPPWDIGKPDFNLVHTVTSTPIAPCRVLEIGCGTGDNAVWLAQRSFDVTGIDISELAIQKAREKAAEAGVRCTFAILNILTGHIDGAPFGFIFDRGCFHTLDSASERDTFAQQVKRYLAEDGLWLSLVGNADDEHPNEGPPKLTARDIVSAVEPSFEILSLISTHFEVNLPAPARAWVCLMRKRRIG